MKRRSSKAAGFGNLDIEEYFFVGFFFSFFNWGEQGGDTEKGESCIPGEEADLTEIQYTNNS